MGTFLYRCPNTGFRIQGWTDKELTDADAYVSVTCSLCKQTHLVSPITGKGPNEVPSKKGNSKKE